MSSTNKTTYYELPQFVDNDIFNPLVDDNDAYDKIDTALHNIANAEADDASEIVGVKSRLDSAEGDIDALEAQNGNSVLTTTAQTLSGAVNELDADASALDGRLDIVEDDINNVSTGLKARVGALETQNGNEVLDTTAQTLSGAVNEIEHDLKTAFVTPQMFGAKGDGVIDDTNAFVALASESGNILIPKGTYVIHSEITIANVIADYGTYSDYEPMYAKKLEIPLNKLSIVKKSVALNSVLEYEESIAKIGNKYYVITNEHSDNANGIIVYDADFAKVSHVSSPKTTVGTCNSCCTDGVYLYVDYDNGYHRKYNPADLSAPVLEVNTNYRETCYYNNSLYAVTITSSQISVSKLDSTMTVLSDTWTIANTSDVLQSATMFKGVLYLTTTYGNFKAVDLVSHEMIKVDYLNEPVEIEAFFEDDGKLCAIGHLVSVAGTFNISSFNDGLSYTNVKVLEVDTNVNRIGFTTAVALRNGIYHIIDGKTNGMNVPSDDCIVVWLNKNLICYSTEDNGVWYFRNDYWYFMHPFRAIVETVDTNLYLVEGLNGNLTLNCATYHLEDATKTINHDFSALYTRHGWSNSDQFRFTFLAMTYNVAPMGSDVYAVHGLLSKTSLILWCKSLLGVDATVNANLTGRILIA